MTQYYDEEKKAFMFNYILAARASGRAVDDKANFRQELIETAEDLYKRALKSAEVPAPPFAEAVELSKEKIFEIFTEHGFTIKEGQTDLKDYVYAAARALLEESRRT